MLYKTLIVTLGIFTLTGCNAQQTTKNSQNEKTNKVTTEIKTPEKMTNQGNIIYFNEGENKFLKEYQMNFTFKNISEDSRCPAGVECVWAGVAVANIELMSTTSRPATLQFATMNMKAKNYQKTHNFNGFTITLVQVTPTPDAKTGSSTTSGKYKIGIIINKENNQNQNNITTK